jgi:hypothetical protein
VAQQGRGEAHVVQRKLQPDDAHEAQLQQRSTRAGKRRECRGELN